MSDSQQINNLKAEIESLKFNQKQSQNRLRLIEKRFETLNSPIWKRILFRLDGWSAWHYINKKPKWRPWRKWWTS